jgi:hypothetical protein
MPGIAAVRQHVAKGPYSKMAQLLPPSPQIGDRTMGANPSVVRNRLSIGLAPGARAARGFAHIGVLGALLARGLRPDIITGTSAGRSSVDFLWPASSMPSQSGRSA